jgi:3,4-dihydroxy 2-butanone 4-phosphate synthase/GTP cyclohydrolase II
MSDGRSPPSLCLAPFSEVLADFRVGRPVIVVDSSEREDEGDICVAAEVVTSEVISFLMREARGLICVSISKQLASRLNLPLQVYNNNSPFQTPFAVSIDHKEVVPFGVSASARARTIKELLNPAARPQDFVTPGHIFPLIANEAGVMARQGHTEGVFDLARLAGLAPAGILCEILNSDGTMARGEQLQSFAEKHHLRVTSIAEIRKYRALNEIAVRPLSSREVETDFGAFNAIVYADDVGGKEHIALVRGDLATMPFSVVVDVTVDNSLRVL